MYCPLRFSMSRHRFLSQAPPNMLDLPIVETQGGSSSSGLTVAILWWIISYYQFPSPNQNMVFSLLGGGGARGPELGTDT